MGTVVLCTIIHIKQRKHRLRLHLLGTNHKPVIYGYWKFDPRHVAKPDGTWKQKSLFDHEIRSNYSTYLLNIAIIICSTKINQFHFFKINLKYIMNVSYPTWEQQLLCSTAHCVMSGHLYVDCKLPLKWKWPPKGWPFMWNCTVAILTCV